MSKRLTEIAERHPLEHSFEDDARHIWPKRWTEAHAVCDALEAKLRAAKEYIEELENPMAQVARMAYVRKKYRAAAQEKE